MAGGPVKIQRTRATCSMVVSPCAAAVSPCCHSVTGALAVAHRGQIAEGAFAAISGKYFSAEYDLVNRQPPLESPDRDMQDTPPPGGIPHWASGAPRGARISVWCLALGAKPANQSLRRDQSERRGQQKAIRN